MLSIKDLNGLIALVQSGALEIHPWGSTASDWERPDVIIMDLDPGEEVAWESVIAAAEETRERLQALGLAAFVKTSGGKGLHVVAPLKPKAEWPQVKAFTKGIADAMTHDSPSKYRRDDHEIEAPRKDTRRLSAQSARRDGGRALLHARPSRSRRLDAARLGRT